MGRQIIELNGKKYDMETGKPVVDDFQVPSKSEAPEISTASAHTPSNDIGKTKAAKNPKQKNITVRYIRSADNIHLKPKRSATLMRSAVKNPFSEKTNVLKPDVQNSKFINNQRLSRAKQHARSQSISKFHYGNKHNVHPTINKQLGHIPVQQPPGRQDNDPLVTGDRQLGVTTSQEDYAHKNSSAIFEQAVANAQSHQAPAPKLAKSKNPWPLASTVVTVLLLGGFIAYQNTYQISMRLAANRAGINATLPDYKPAGFSISESITYSPGQVAVTYQANSDDREFLVTQKKTDWDQQELISNFLDKEIGSYQVYQEETMDVYIYGEHNATWIKDGIWYTVEGDSSLTGSQLTRLAASM